MKDNTLESQELADQTGSTIEIDYFANLPELRKEDFSVRMLERFVGYYSVVLEKYANYSKTPGDNKLYLDLLFELTRPRGNIGFGTEQKEDEPISMLLKRMCTKAELATLANYLTKIKESPDRKVDALDVADYLSHGIIKSLMYDRIDDELSRELSLLAAHAYEVPVDGPISSVNAMKAREFYEQAGAEKHKARIAELRAIIDGAEPNADFEKGIRSVEEILAEAETIVDKYKDMISLDAIMSDLHKIHGIVTSLLK